MLARFAMIRRGAKGFWRSLRDILVFTHRRFAVIQGPPRVNIGASEQHGSCYPPPSEQDGVARLGRGPGRSLRTRLKPSSEY